MATTTTTYSAPPDELLHLIIRFTASIADVPLSIPSPRTTTALNLKRLIRKHLPPTLSSNRLRLISAGKVLPEALSLNGSLNLGLPNAPATRATGGLRKDAASNEGAGEAAENNKGKTVLRGDGAPGPPPRRLYIHCSIGDAITPEELVEEEKRAEEAQSKLVASLEQRLATSTPSQPSSPTQRLKGSGGASEANGSTTTPAPRGFDRLAATGFTRDDIQSLRRSFLAQLSMDHTPDTMPSGSALLVLEDRWLDSTVNADTLTTDGLGGDRGLGDEDAEADQLENLFWGNIWGFFCPLLAIVWGFREDGVWTRRRQIAVLTGIIINLVFGFARLSS